MDLHTWLASLGLPATLALSVLKTGLETLLKTHRGATERQQNAWHGSLTLSALLEQGLGELAFHWLLRQAYLWQAVATLAGPSGLRTFRPLDNCLSQPDGCYILSGRGAELAFNLGLLTAPAGLADMETVHGRPQVSSLTPCWVPGPHELRLGDFLVKAFPRAAPNQFPILEAFAARQWAPWVANCLTSDAECQAPERAHNAVRRLNEELINPWVSFGRKGRGLTWERAKSVARSCPRGPADRTSNDTGSDR